jgi:hypothetical protein
MFRNLASIFLAIFSLASCGTASNSKYPSGYYSSADLGSPVADISFESQISGYQTRFAINKRVLTDTCSGMFNYVDGHIRKGVTLMSEREMSSEKIPASRVVSIFSEVFAQGQCKPPAVYFVPEENSQYIAKMSYGTNIGASRQRNSTCVFEIYKVKANGEREIVPSMSMNQCADKK